MLHQLKAWNKVYSEMQFQQKTIGPSICMHCSCLTKCWSSTFTISGLMKKLCSLQIMSRGVSETDVLFHYGLATKEKLILNKNLEYFSLFFSESHILIACKLQKVWISEKNIFSKMVYCVMRNLWRQTGITTGISFVHLWNFDCLEKHFNGVCKSTTPPVHILIVSNFKVKLGL